MRVFSEPQVKIGAGLIGLAVLAAAWYEAKRRKATLQSLRGTWDAKTEKETISTFQHRRRMFLRSSPFIIGLFLFAFWGFEHSPQTLDGQPIPFIATVSIIAFLLSWGIFMWLAFFYYKCPFCKSTPNLIGRWLDMNPERCRLCGIPLR